MGATVPLPVYKIILHAVSDNFTSQLLLTYGAADSNIPLPL